MPGGPVAFASVSGARDPSGGASVAEHCCRVRRSIRDACTASPSARTAGSRPHFRARTYSVQMTGGKTRMGWSARNRSDGWCPGGVPVNRRWYGPRIARCSYRCAGRCDSAAGRHRRHPHGQLAAARPCFAGQCSFRAALECLADAIAPPAANALLGAQAARWNFRRSPAWSHRLVALCVVARCGRRRPFIRLPDRLGCGLAADPVVGSATCASWATGDKRSATAPRRSAKSGGGQIHSMIAARMSPSPFVGYFSSLPSSPVGPPTACA